MAVVKKTSALVVGSALGIGVVTILAGIRGPGSGTRLGEQAVSSGGSAEETELVGKPFAESLGLPVIADPPGGCLAIAEAPPDDTMYCLDGIADNEQEVQLLGMRVNGLLPTGLDEQLVGLEAELDSLADTPENEARRNEILVRIGDLMAQIEAERGGG